MSSNTSLADFPTELLDEIFSFVKQRQDLHALSLTCQRFNVITIQFLYRNYEFVYSDQTLDRGLLPFVRTLQGKKHLRELVRTVRIDERVDASRRFALSDENNVTLQSVPSTAEELRSLLWWLMRGGRHSTQRRPSHGHIIPQRTWFEDATFIDNLMKKAPIGGTREELLHWIHSTLEEQQLVLHTALVMSLCSDIESLDITPFNAKNMHSLDSLCPLIQAGSQDPSHLPFHGFPKLTSLTLDFASGFLTNLTPEENIDFLRILCIPSLRKLELRSTHIDGRNTFWAMLAGAGFESPITELSLRGHDVSGYIHLLVMWCLRNLKSVQMELDSDPQPSNFFLRQRQWFLSAIKPNRPSLQNVAVYSVNKCAYIPQPNTYINEAARRDHSWHCYSNLTELVCAAPPLGALINPPYPRQSIKSINSLATVIDEIVNEYPSSLENLTLLIDPRFLCQMEKMYSREVDLDGRYLLKYTDFVHIPEFSDLQELDVPIWGKEVWSRIWSAATTTTHFENLRQVSLEFRYHEDSVASLETVLDLPASGTRVTVWESSSTPV